jgi:hypothetical protein
MNADPRKILLQAGLEEEIQPLGPEGEIACLVVPPEILERLVRSGEGPGLAARLRELGFRHAAVDLAGGL